MKRRFQAVRPARRLRRQSHWAVMLGTALAASTTTGVQPAAAAQAGSASQATPQTGASAADTRRLEFEIPAGPLDGAVAELRSSEAELQTNLLNQQVSFTATQFNMEKAQVKTEADESLARAGLLSGIELKRSQLDLSQLKKTYEIEGSRLEKLRG